jgi:uncharacterized Ntn-hydrolase superfamily protein
MTFSIVARCPETGMFGVAVSSSSPAVAARCAYARAGAGAATSQNVTDPALGTMMLNLLEQGLGAREAAEQAATSTRYHEFRQLTAVDRQGIGFVYTGSRALGISASCAAQDVACAGNLLANRDIPQTMVEAFQLSEGHIADRLLEALRAALRAGGEEGPVRSAGLMVVDKVPWPIIDLRVDWDEDPIEKLAEIWSVYRPQVDDYVTRALHPVDAPGYGVPGDDS